MHLSFDRKFVVLVVVIVIIIAAAIAIFRFQYCTQEERDANRNTFMMGTAVLVALAIGVYLLTVYACNRKDHGEGESEAGQEYGIREAIRERWDQAKAERDARAAAKKAGMNPEEVDRAGRQAKADFRQVKRAGQEAAFKAKEAERAKIAGAKPPVR